MLGGIRVCLVPPAPNAAGESLIGLRRRRTRTILQLGPGPNTVLPTGHNSPENRLISEVKGRNAEWERVAGLLFQEPLPPPGPR